MNTLKVLVTIYENEVKRLVKEYKTNDYSYDRMNKLDGQIIAYNRVIEDLKGLKDLNTEITNTTTTVLKSLTDEEIANILKPTTTSTDQQYFEAKNKKQLFMYLLATPNIEQKTLLMLLIKRDKHIIG